jgi:uncharacterized membrane protein
VARHVVHLYLGRYDTLEGAERDLKGLKKLHAEGLVGAYDAAVVTTDADGAPRIERRKHAGHPVWAGAGIGAILGVLTPFIAIPFALVGAGAGALVGHARGGLSTEDAEELAEALKSGEAALAVVGDAAMGPRIEQVFPEAARRVAKVLDLDEDDVAAALRQPKQEG